MKITVLVLVFVIAGCAIDQRKYMFPRERGTLPDKVYKVDEPFEKAWTTLVNYAPGKYFTIRNANKESGLITLHFGRTRPGNYIDCGNVPVKSLNRSVSYIGVVENSGAVELLGTANLIIKSIDENNTSISFTTHYDLKIKDGDLPKQTWNFATNERQSRNVGELTIMCMSTFAAEVDIVAGINFITGGHTREVVQE